MEEILLAFLRGFAEGAGFIVGLITFLWLFLKDHIKEYARAGRE